jgi:hypothetical protein
VNSFRPRLTYSNVVSTICLFLLLGGAAWAAPKLAKNSVGTRQLKNGAVTGAKVQDGSLTGADIQASTLGTVPKAAAADSATSAGHATSADSAGRAATAGHADEATNAGHATGADSATRAADATTLDGLGPGAFYPAGGVQRIDAAPVFGAAQSTALYSAHGVALSASCHEGGVAGSIVLTVSAASGAPGALMSVGMIEREGTVSKAVITEFPLISMPEPVFQVAGAHLGNSGQGVGTMIFSDHELAVAFTLELRVTPNDECQLSGTAAVSG